MSARASQRIPADQALAALPGTVDLVVDPEVLASYRTDQGARAFTTPGEPAALLRPRSDAEVQSILRAAHAHRVPVVIRGAGSGLSGGANAIDGCWVLCTERLTTLDVHPESLTATAGAGVINDALRQAAGRHGLTYPPDPASAEFSTLGGNIATDAGGLCCVKYGGTRDFLLGATLVLADGRRVRLGGSTRKDAVGLDLLSLVCGSEGRLGVITQATVRLVPVIRGAATVVAGFGDLGSATRAIGTILGRFVPSMLEVIDRVCINAVEDVHPMELDRDAEALVFARADGGVAEAEVVVEACSAAGADLVAVSDDPAEGRMLTAARRLVYPALERQGATLLDDVAVPLHLLGALVEGVQEISEAMGVTVGTFGHAGDGNLHPTVVYSAADPDERSAAQEAFARILTLARRLGGTVTGEHGVGTLKLLAAREQLRESLDLHEAVRRVFDPEGVLNPGRGW